jgi:hypothetical protein
MSRRVVKVANGDLLVILEDTYECQDIKEAKKRFNTFKINGILIKCVYDSEKWIINDQTQNTEINFTLSKSDYEKSLAESIGIPIEEFQMMLKGYAIHLLGMIDASGISGRIRIIKKLFLQEDQSNIYLQNNSIAAIEEFCDFINLNCSVIDYIWDKVIVYEKEKGKPRILSSFLSYFIFTEEIKNLWINGDEIERIKYFPLYFWVRITFIIPLRVTEMIVTPYQCISLNDGKYYITLRRSILKGNSILKKVGYRVETDYKKMRYEIPRDIALDIEYYCEQTHERERLFLFDYEYERKSINEMYTSQALRKLMDDFYNKYLLNNHKYDFAIKCSGLEEVEKVRLGDSRHLAMINLQQQGVPIATIQELAYHADVNTTAFYAANVMEYLECMSLVSYSRTVKQRQDTEMKLIKRLKAIDSAGINKECLSAKRIYDQANIEDCIKEGCLQDCLGCTYYNPSSEAINNIYKEHERECKKECRDIIEYLERYRKIKGFNNTLDEEMLKLQNKLTRYKNACDLKYREGYKKWEEKNYIPRKTF